MTPQQWHEFKTAAKGGRLAQTLVAVIVDSPWIPGYAGISHLDYYLDPELWFQANLKVWRDFPDLICIPSWWVEYGMAVEPSAAGNRIHFWKDQPPGQSPVLLRLEDAASLAPVNPQTDGLMPFVLWLYERHKPRIRAAGHVVPVAAARGPLCLASFLRGVTQFMTDIVENPAGAHTLLRYSTQVVIDWLRAQAAAIGEGVEGILVLDDLAGFLSRRAYLEFGHPYFKQICDAFPPGWVKVYHNDANIRPFLDLLPEAGFDVLNWSHKIPFAEAREKTGGRLCLMGNVPPLELGVQGTPDQVRAAARAIVEQSASQGLILSLGGGVSMNTPAANLHALAQAAREISSNTAQTRS
jgi:uroporphyrinogen decarboxylase